MKAIFIDVDRSWNRLHLQHQCNHPLRFVCIGLLLDRSHHMHGWSPAKTWTSTSAQMTRYLGNLYQRPPLRRERMDDWGDCNKDRRISCYYHNHNVIREHGIFFILPVVFLGILRLNIIWIYVMYKKKKEILVGNKQPLQLQKDEGQTSVESRARWTTEFFAKI